MAEEICEEPAGCGERSEGDEEVKAEDRRWQDQRESDDGAHECALDAGAGGDPPGDWNRDEQQQSGCAEGKPQR